MILRDIRRILLLAIGAGAAIWVCGILLAVNRSVYVQTDAQETLLELQPSQPVETLDFPFAVSGTSLIAEALVSYDGPFLEDGYGREVFNCVALLLHNTAAQEIRQVRISVQGTECWMFEAKNIPPNARILVLESSGAQLQDFFIISCAGWQAVEDGEQPVKGFLQFDCVDMGTVAVTNVGQTAITDVRLLHKNWLPDSEIYVGGITYETRIDRIEPGKTIFLQPEHYAYGYSKFVIWYGHK